MGCVGWSGVCVSLPVRRDIIRRCQVLKITSYDYHSRSWPSRTTTHSTEDRWLRIGLQVCWQSILYKAITAVASIVFAYAGTPGKLNAVLYFLTFHWASTPGQGHLFVSNEDTFVQCQVLILISQIRAFPYCSRNTQSFALYEVSTHLPVCYNINLHSDWHCSLLLLWFIRRIACTRICRNFDQEGRIWNRPPRPCCQHSDCSACKL